SDGSAPGAEGSVSGVGSFAASVCPAPHAEAEKARSDAASRAPRPLGSGLRARPVCRFAPQKGQSVVLGRSAARMCARQAVHRVRSCFDLIGFVIFEVLPWTAYPR